MWVAVQPARRLDSEPDRLIVHPMGQVRMSNLAGEDCPPRPDEP